MSDVANVPSCYVIVRRGTKILLLLRENTGFMDGFYTLPAGRVEAYESFSQGAARELKEEVGLTAKLGNLQHIHTLHRYSPHNHDVRVDVFFEANQWDGEPTNVEADKHSEMAWFDITDLPKMMDYQGYALAQIALGEPYSEYGWDQLTA